MKSEAGSRNGSEEFDTLIGPVTNDFDDFFVSIIAMKIPTHFYVSILNKFFLVVTKNIFIAVRFSHTFCVISQYACLKCYINQRTHFNE